MRLASLRLCLVLLLGDPVAATVRAEDVSWVQMVPGGLEARAITQHATCPPAEIDGSPAEMHVRAPGGDSFPILACAIAIPSSAGVASVAGVPLALPKPEMRRILVMGDTGCRMRGTAIQACNDPVAWPFRLIADVAAHMKPDLVIHVGDYHYRETPCPVGNAGCAGSPSGDSWAAWQADFFSPAKTLLGIAPWVFARGNHEECDRGGKGWMRALDPRPFDPSYPCVGPARAFSARVGELNLVVMDVSSAEEGSLSPEQVAELRPQFADLARAPSPTWLVLHRPIWSVVRVEDQRVVGGNRTLDAAAKDALPTNVTLMLSGHLHVFQVLNFDHDLPPQMITGHGGTLLDQGTPPDPAGLIIEGVTVTSGISVPGSFGFVMLEKGMNGWQATNYDVRGNPMNYCNILDRRVRCE